MPQEKFKILILGFAGGLARLTAQLILDRYPHCYIIGVDSRPCTDFFHHPRLETQQIRYSRSHFEALFHQHQFQTVFHLGRISHALSSTSAIRRRVALNLIGTKTIMDLCLKSQTQKLIIMSTFHVYGALHDNPVFLTEHAPLRASIDFPDLHDVVEMDQMCQNWMWENQEQVSAVIFRPCNIIGANILNAITKFLLNHKGFHPMDYNPQFQFIHEYDMANILALSLEKVPMGIYNIAPSDYIDLKKAREIIHGSSYPLPISLLGLTNHWLNQLNLGLPPYLIDYLKYSCLIDNKKIRSILGDQLTKHSIAHSLELLRLAL